MSLLFRAAVLVLCLVVGVAPATAEAYVLLANGTSDQHYIFRDTGAAGLTTGEYTVTWQQWIEADRPAQFQTYYSIGPASFTSNNDYDVAFDGDGAVSNNMAVGATGGDTYSAVLPVVGAWKNMAMRIVSTGGNNQDHIFYFDLAAGTSNQVTASSFLARAWTSDARLVFSSNFWASDAEGTNGRYRCAKLFTRLLSEADTQSEASSCAIVVSSANLWACWPLTTDLLDKSGNARDLSNNGTVSFVDDGAGGCTSTSPPTPERSKMGVGT